MPNKNGRMRIARAALELFAGQGIGRTSTREIAKHAGLAQGTLYRHYSTKDDLAVALFLDAAGRLLTCLEASLRRDRRPEGQIRFLVRAFFQFASQDRSAWQYLMHGHPPVRAVPQGTRLPKDVVVEVVRRGMKQGAFATTDAVLGAALVIGMTVRSIFFLKQGLLKRPQNVVSGEVADATLRALGPKNKERRRSR